MGVKALLLGCVAQPVDSFLPLHPLPKPLWGVFSEPAKGTGADLPVTGVGRVCVLLRAKRGCAS